MIRYALLCSEEHAFEAWFSDSASFDTQNSRNLIECPYCGSIDIRKQIMAPAIGQAHRTRDTQDKIPVDAAQLSRMIGDIQQHIETNYHYVGKDFAKTAIAMHQGDMTEKPVWGETTPEEADRLRNEGVPAYPLPEPFAPTRPPCPDKTN